MLRKCYADLSNRSKKTYLKNILNKPVENDRLEVRLDNNGANEIIRDQVAVNLPSCSLQYENAQFNTDQVDNTSEDRIEPENRYNSETINGSSNEFRVAEDVSNRMEDVGVESYSEESVESEDNQENENDFIVRYNLEETYENDDEWREVEDDDSMEDVEEESHDGEHEENRDEYENENDENEAEDDEMENVEIENNEDNDEEEQEDENDENIDDDNLRENDPPLYTNAPLTVSESMLLMLTIARNHNITQVCLAELLTVINMHCPADNLQRNSLYKFKKFFSLNDDSMTNIKKNYYCESCLRYLNSARVVCNQCQGERDSKTAYFIEMSISDQLQTLFERQGFHDKLQHRFNRQAIHPDIISDIYDGRLYKQWFNNGFLANQSNISFTWYTDGVPVFQSSKINMWPIYLTINELPCNERTKKENLLLAALWFGSKKPDGNHFVSKLYDQFRNLFHGHNFYLPDSRIINVKCLLLMGTCDIVARTQFLNFTQHNGQFGCTVCTSPGDTFHLPSGGTTHVYEYEEQLPLRTSQQSIEYGNMALQWNISVMGVKGPSIFSRLMPDFITGTCIDRMHCIDSGVVKKLLTLWFDRDYSTFPFSLYNVIHVVNQRLIEIKPPKFVHRIPRSIEDLNHWKSSEFKMWFFYYSAPVLNGIMSADAITGRMLMLAENCLSKFTREFQILYGLQFCSINIHQILHLSKCVKDLGPLWAYSCYSHEDLNGRFLNYIHGTNHIDSQIASSHIRLLNVQLHLERLSAGPINDFCLSGRHQVKICEEIFENCFSVGIYTLIDEEEIADPIRQGIENMLPRITRIEAYSRLLKDRKLYISECYTRSLQTQSSYILFKTEQGLLAFASIYCFIKTLCCTCEADCRCHPSHYAVIRTITSAPIFGVNITINNQAENVTLPYIHRSELSENFTAILISSIVSVCVFMPIDDDNYIAIPINDKELE